MEFLVKITNRIQQLNKKEFERYLIGGLAVVVLLMGCLVYFIHAKSNDMLSQIKKLETLANKSVKLLGDYEKIQGEEARLQAILGKQKDFNIQIFFEQFCKEQNIIPISGWRTPTDQINPSFEEIVLPASFKDQTTEKLVKILEEIDKREIVYLKNLTIKTDRETRKIAFDITIATKKSK